MENKIISAFKNNKLLLNIDTNKLNFSDVKGKLITLKEGQLLFKQGDSSDYLYLIINGMIRVVENEEALVKNSIFLSESDFFGHTDLYESTVRKTMAIAAADSYVIAVTKAELNFLLWQDPNILINLKKYCGFSVLTETKKPDVIEDEQKLIELENNIETFEVIDTEVKEFSSDDLVYNFSESEINLNDLNLEEESIDLSENIEKIIPEDDFNIIEEENEIKVEPFEDVSANLAVDLSQLPEFIDDEEPENIEIKFSDDLSLGSFRTTTFYEDSGVPTEITEEAPKKAIENEFNIQDFNIELTNSDKTETDQLNLKFDEEVTNIDSSFNLNTDDINLDEFKPIEEELKLDNFNFPKDEKNFEFDLTLNSALDEDQKVGFIDDISFNVNELDEEIKDEVKNEEITFNFDIIQENEEKLDIAENDINENNDDSSSLVEQYLKQFENNEIVVENEKLETSPEFEFKFEDDEIIKPEGEILEGDDFDKNEFLKNEFSEFNLENNTEEDINSNEFNITEEKEESFDNVLEQEKQIINESISNPDVEELRKQGVMNIEQLQMILKAAQLVSSKIKLDDVLQNIVSVATNITKADRGTLYLIDKDKGEIWSKVVMGNELKEIRLKIGDGIAGWVAQTGEIVNIKDVQNDSRFKASFDKSSGYQTKTMICFPIRNAEGEIIGVHQLLNSGNGEFTQLDETFLNAISIHAAIALENAELVEKLLQFERISSLGKMANFLIQDIKNPILISKRYAEHLKTKHLQADSDKIVDMILEQLNQVADLVLTTSNYSEKNKVLRQINTNLISVLNDYNSRLEQTVKKKNCNIVTKFDIDVLVRVDLKEFYQAYQHIIKNAADSMPDGGTITVKTIKEAGFVKILITDTGVGIPDNVKEKIFDPFMSYGKKEGTGLGLAIAKKIVNEHSGTISFESVVGQGSTFIVKLPIAQDF